MPQESPRELCRRKVCKLLAELVRTTGRQREEFEIVAHELEWQIRLCVLRAARIPPEAEPPLPNLREREKQILKVAEETPHKQKWMADHAAEVARISFDINNTYFLGCLSRLVELGLLHKPTRGYYAITEDGVRTRDRLRASGML